MTNPGSMHYNYLHTTMTMKKDQYDRKASQRGKDTVTCGWEPLMTEDRKPPLESCARRNVPGSGEAQRRTGVNGDRAGYVFVSIRGGTAE